MDTYNMYNNPQKCNNEGTTLYSARDIAEKDLVFRATSNNNNSTLPVEV